MAPGKRTQGIRKGGPDKNRSDKIKMEKITLGISACLLGENVRYDGGHKHDRFLTDTLGKYVTYRPVCPEMECGLGVPRESMRLVGDPESPRLVTVRSRQDHTERMVRWARQRVTELEKEKLCGFIFKSDSPSSGMERVKVYKDGGMPQKNGIGVFARIFMEHFPLMPVEEEGRLHDPLIRENFIERIFRFGTMYKNRGLHHFHKRNFRRVSHITHPAGLPDERISHVRQSDPHLSLQSGAVARRGEVL
jgi:uncharacterized protein YbbK (DUF523 family)